MSGRQAQNRNSLYGRRWRRARIQFLTDNPLCRFCRQDGKITPASVVDHIKPHEGNPSLFWGTDNWQPLCQPHHDATKQRMEKGRQSAGCDVNGNPIEPQPHWVRGEVGG